jgi:hypothetical protein
MTKRIWIFFVFLGLMISAGSAYAQKKTRKEAFKENHSPFGRKKKEKKNQKVFKKRGGRMFARRSNQGNSNTFASNRIIGKKGFFENVFGPKAGRNASLRKTKPAKKSENKALYKKERTRAKNYHRAKQQKQNRKREKTRKRGNVLFAKKKH